MDRQRKNFAYKVDIRAGEVDHFIRDILTWEDLGQEVTKQCKKRLD